MTLLSSSLRWPLLCVLMGLCSLGASQRALPQAPIVFEDFEGYRTGETPYHWKTNKGSSLVPASPKTMTDGHQYRIVEEKGNKFARATMNNYAYRLIRLNENPTVWNLDEHPVLSWNWRIHKVPAGAREDEKRLNDTAAAVYVTFGQDWLGRPKSIKYTFSSTLPPGTTASYGPLKILVVGSATHDPLGTWMTISRNVQEDYRQLFGKPLDTSKPLGITLFSDADDVDDDSARVDFDNILLLPPAADLPTSQR